MGLYLRESINKSWAFLVIHALFDDTPRPVPQRNFGPRARRSMAALERFLDVVPWCFTMLVLKPKLNKYLNRVVFSHVICCINSYSTFTLAGLRYVEMFRTAISGEIGDG